MVGDTRAGLPIRFRQRSYYPLYRWAAAGSAMLAIRASGDVEQLALPVQRACRSWTATCQCTTCSPWISCWGGLRSMRALMLPLLGFAVISLLLAATGIFGVLSYISHAAYPGDWRPDGAGSKARTGSAPDVRMVAACILWACVWSCGQRGAVRLIQSMLYGHGRLIRQSFVSGCDLACSRLAGLPGPGVASFTLRSHASIAERVILWRRTTCVLFQGWELRVPGASYCEARSEIDVS